MQSLDSPQTIKANKKMLSSMAIGQQSFDNLISEYGTRYFRIRKDFVMIEVCQTATNIIFFSIQTHVIT